MNGVDLAKAAGTLWPTIRIMLIPGDPNAVSAGLPDEVTFMPKPWRSLDLLVQAEKAVRDPLSPIA